MPKLDGLIATLHLEKQLITAAVCIIAVTVWITLKNSALGWPLLLGSTLVTIACVLFIAKKSKKIKVLLQEIEDC